MILWDTKGIEAADYQNTMESLKKEMEDSFKTLDEKKMIDVAYLCVKETSSRIEEREKELLDLTKKWNIPTIVIFTNTQAEAGDAFVKEAQRVIDEEWGFKGFIKAYVRVNSVAYSFRGMEVPVEGLKELVDETKKCLIDAKKNKEEHFVGAQTLMIEEMNRAFEVKIEKSVAASLITGLLAVTAIGQTAKTIVANLIKFIPVVGSVAGSATAVAITEGIGFAYLKVLETCFNDETGEVELPAMDTIKSLFKESYLSLDTIKKLKP